MFHNVHLKSVVTKLFLFKGSDIFVDTDNISKTVFTKSSLNNILTIFFEQFIVFNKSLNHFVLRMLLQSN